MIASSPSVEYKAGYTYAICQPTVFTSDRFGMGFILGIWPALVWRIV